jgi:hypothetical protein
MFAGNAKTCLVHSRLVTHAHGDADPALSPIWILYGFALNVLILEIGVLDV